MKLKTTALNTLFYFIYMLVSCVLTMVVESLLVFILDKFIVIPFPALTVLRLVIYSVGMFAIMAGLGWFEGYREGTPAIGETVVGGLFAMIGHFVIALLFNFQSFVAGPVRYAAGLLAHGMNITADKLSKKTSILWFILLFVLYGCAYIGILALTRYFGAQRRIMDRAVLRGREAPDEDAPEV